MTIQLIYGDDTYEHRQIYRNVIKGRMAQYTEGFVALQQSNKWGFMLQLKGNERITLRKFGTHDLPTTTK